MAGTYYGTGLSLFSDDEWTDMREYYGNAKEDNYLQLNADGTGSGTDQIGRFDIMVDTDRNAIDTFTWQSAPINDRTCPRDEEMKRYIRHYQQATAEKDDRLYSVAVQKYHFTNLKAFLDITPQEAEENAKVRVLTTSARDVIEEYLSVNPHLSRSVEGRLVVEP